MDAVSDRDFAIEFMSVSSLIAIHLSRLAEDFIIYNSNAFNLIAFKDSMLTGSFRFFGLSLATINTIISIILSGIIIKVVKNYGKN